MRCKRCGGNLIRDYWGICCLWCGADYDRNGNLIRKEGKNHAESAERLTPEAEHMSQMWSILAGSRG